MQKRLLTLTTLLFIAAIAFAQGKAKYVFYFIGDGMGVNQVNGTETYLAALEGQIGTTPLCFASFPNVGLVTTFSATNGVTDSAASGTALSCGKKTKNQVLGLLKDQKTEISSVATWAQAAGAAVGISTSVSVDHATPAAFYAHVPYRKMYYEIGKQLTQSNFDFFAGSDFKKPFEKQDSEGTLYQQCEKAGYTIARGYADYQDKRKASKMILLQTEEASQRDRASLPYAINRKEDDLSLSQITTAGIDFLQQKKKKGFFFMVEGGKIDWACHANDAGTAFREVKDMDDAVKIAFDFYKKHPKETLIVITADHETGGLSLGRGPYELNTAVLQYQKMSTDRYSLHLDELCKKAGDQLSWKMLEDDLKANWGFWDQIPLTKEQSQKLKDAANGVLTHSEGVKIKNLYGSASGLADAARSVMSEVALIGWQSGGHSNGYVPVFAIGAGAQHFNGRLDNTMIPQLIAKAAGWKIRK